MIMDTLGRRASPKVREAIDAAGARLPGLPPCSPDVTPIEFAFARLKSLLRAVARTRDALRIAVGLILHGVPPDESCTLSTVRGYQPAERRMLQRYCRTTPCRHVRQGVVPARRSRCARVDA